MPKDKTESHQRIKKVAKEEFLEKGFENVSMREIGRRAGLTPSALYRHFSSKEAMFSSLVDPFIAELAAASRQHEQDAYRNFDQTASADAMVGDNAVEMIKNLYTEHRDELRLILCCSHGTKYENFLHELIWQESEATWKAFEHIREKGIAIKPVTVEELHVLLSAYMTAVLEPVVHDWPPDKAMRCFDLVEEFFIPAWKHIMGF